MPVEFISVGPNNNDGLGGFLDEIIVLFHKFVPPTVLTTSYGFDEDGISPFLALFVVFPFMTLSYAPLMRETVSCASPTRSSVLVAFPYFSLLAMAVFPEM